METRQQQQQQHSENRHQCGVVDGSPLPSTTAAKDSTSKNFSTGGAKSALQTTWNIFADFYFPRRYIVVLLLFLGLCVVHAQRVNVGVAVVSIVDSRHRLLSTEIDNNSAVAYVKDSVS